MKILLVNPTTADQPGFAKYATFPNGILYLAAVLEKHGYSVEIYDNNIDKRQPEDFIVTRPDVIGFSVLTGRSISNAIAQSIEFKKLLPGTKIVWGGVHPSLLPEQTISESYIDYVVIGEGEYTLLELVQHLESNAIKLEEIKGIAYKKDGKVTFNEPRPFLAQLDELPDPAWHLIDVKKYSDSTLNTSRGCPFRCAFCYNLAFNKGSVRSFSADRIVSQIEHLRQQYGAVEIKFYEDNFTANRARLREFCNSVINNNLKIKWNCESRIGLKEDDVAVMAKSGCTWVGLGVESGSPRILEFIQKSIKLEDVRKTCALLAKHKIMPVVYLMTGLPTETLEDFKMTLELMKGPDVAGYQYMIYRPYPGTPLFEYCVNQGLFTPPKKLADWANASDLFEAESNLSEVPQETINKSMAKFRIAYPLQTVRYYLRHNLGYVFKRFINPIAFWRYSVFIIRHYANLLKSHFRQ